MLSISATLAMPTAASAQARISAWSAARRGAAHRLESSIVARRAGGGPAAANMTAAATTGPAQGPRPASSTPATRPAAAFSSEKSGRSRAPLFLAMSPSSTGACAGRWIRTAQAGPGCA